MENEKHIRCESGICEGLTWTESKILIVQKHGHEYWTQWVHRVTWTLYGEKVTLYDDPED